MKLRVAGALAVVALLLAGCGDDADSADSEGDLAAFCAVFEELDDQEEAPSDDQIDELRDTAPPEVRDDVDTLTDAIEDVDDPNDDSQFEEIFSDQDVVEAVGNLETFVTENCDASGNDTGDDTGDDTGGDTTSTTEADDGDDGDDTTTTTSEPDDSTTSTTTG